MYKRGCGCGCGCVHVCTGEDYTGEGIERCDIGMCVCR